MTRYALHTRDGYVARILPHGARPRIVYTASKQMAQTWDYKSIAIMATLHAGIDAQVEAVTTTSDPRQWNPITERYEVTR